MLFTAHQFDEADITEVTDKKIALLITLKITLLITKLNEIAWTIQLFKILKVRSKNT